MKIKLKKCYWCGHENTKIVPNTSLIGKILKFIGIEIFIGETDEKI